MRILIAVDLPDACEGLVSDALADERTARWLKASLHRDICWRLDIPSRYQAATHVLLPSDLLAEAIDSSIEADVS